MRVLRRAVVESGTGPLKAHRDVTLATAYGTDSLTLFLGRGFLHASLSAAARPPSRLQHEPQRARQIAQLGGAGPDNFTTTR